MLLSDGGITLSLKDNSQISHSNKLLLQKVWYLLPGWTQLYWQLYPYSYNMLLSVGEMAFSLKEN